MVPSDDLSVDRVSEINVYRKDHEEGKDEPARQQPLIPCLDIDDPPVVSSQTRDLSSPSASTRRATMRCKSAEVPDPNALVVRSRGEEIRGEREGTDGCGVGCVKQL